MNIYKKQLFILILLMPLLLISCKMSGDKLATYEGGFITRGEFHDWLDMMQFSKESVLKDKNQQKNRIKQMGMDRVTLLEAINAGYDKNPDTEEILKLAKRNFTANFYRKQIKEKMSFKEDTLKLKVIKLLVKNYKIEKNKRVNLTEAETEKEFSLKNEIAAKIIKELDSGKKFEDMVKLYSDDPSKKNNGDTGYITREMKSVDFWKAASALNKGEHTKSPVKADSSIYIMKCEDKRELTEKNIGDIIKDENQRNSMKNRLQMALGKNYEEGLLKAPGLVYNENALKATDPEAVLYNVNNIVFKKKDFDNLINLIFKKRGERSLQAVKLDDKIKKDIADKLFREEVLQKEAIANGADKDPKYGKEWEFFRNYTILGGYKNEVIMGDIKIPADEIRKEYEKNRDSAFTTVEKINGADFKKVLPFESVKDRIESSLLNRKRSEKRRLWETDIIRKYKLTVNESKLEGK
jgi:peptidyl-prolyl cis-trans isomerase C